MLIVAYLLAISTLKTLGIQLDTRHQLTHGNSVQREASPISDPWEISRSICPGGPVVIAAPKTETMQLFKGNGSMLA